MHSTFFSALVSTKGHNYSHNSLRKLPGFKEECMKGHVTAENFNCGE